MHRRIVQDKKPACETSTLLEHGHNALSKERTKRISSVIAEEQAPRSGPGLGAPVHTAGLVAQEVTENRIEKDNAQETALCLGPIEPVCRAAQSTHLINHLRADP